jgi:hypothetical protein
LIQSDLVETMEHTAYSASTDAAAGDPFDEATANVQASVDPIHPGNSRMRVMTHIMAVTVSIAVAATSSLFPFCARESVDTAISIEPLRHHVDRTIELKQFDI